MLLKALKVQGFPEMMPTQLRLYADEYAQALSVLGALYIHTWRSARRRGEIAMQTAGSEPDSPSTAIFATLLVTASGHPGNP